MLRTPSCPNVPLWTRWLSGELDDTDSTRLDDHLHDCPACRNTVDSLTDDRSLRSWTEPLTGRTPRFSAFDPPRRAGLIGHLGRYEVESEVAMGGMGVVFRATDTDLKRAVALKVLRVGHDDAHYVVRFLREARAAAKLRHDHVLPIHAVEYSADNRPVLVMPFIEGPTLKKKIADERTLPPRDAAIIVRDIAFGLQAAHDAGLIHRDVKPGNILLDSADGRAKLMDFGLAREAEFTGGNTTDGTILGTLEYMSPEQVRSSATADSLSDVYSLGATLYEALTGVPPFRGSAIDVIPAIEQDDPVPPSDLVRSIPSELNTICTTAMAKERSRRYASARDFADDLNRWLRGEPIHARPASRIERVIKWMRRSPAAAAFLSVLMLMLAGLTVLSIVLARSLNRAEQAEAIARQKTDDVLREQQQTAAAQQARDQVNTFFLKDLLLKADPAQQAAGERTADLTVRTLLDRAARRIDQTPNLDPKVETSLRRHIGNSFFSLSLFREAKPQYEKCLALSTATVGANDLSTLAVRGMLASTHFRLGEQDAAIAELEDVLRLTKSRCGTDHRESCIVRNSLAVHYGEIGSFPRAIELHEKNLAIYRDLYGEDGIETLQTKSSLGVVLSQTGRVNEAEAMLSDAAICASKSLGDDHLTTLLAWSSLAAVYDQRKLFVKSIPIHERCSSLLTKLYGNGNSRTLVARGNLTFALFEAGRHEEAVTLSERVLADAEQSLGVMHVETITPRSNLATYYIRTNQTARAVPLLEVNADCSAKHLADRDPRTIVTRHNLANCLRQIGRHDEAIALWESKVLPAARATFGPKHASTLNFTRNWIRTLETAGKMDLALRERAAMITLERTAYAADDLKIAESLDEYGEVLLKAKRPAEAEKALNEAFGIQSKKRSGAEWTTFRTQLRLGQAILQQGRHSDARPVVLAAYDSLHAIEEQVPDSWKSVLWDEALTALIAIDTKLGRGDDLKRWQEMTGKLKAADKRP